jgi:hypothetical protein
VLAALRPAIRQHKPELVALVSGGTTAPAPRTEVLSTGAPKGPAQAPGTLGHALAPSGWRPEDWRFHFNERAGIREHDGRYPRAEAERLAYGETLDEWRRQHGPRPDRARCAGCDGLVSGADVFDFGTDGRVHSGGDCLENFGRRWHSAGEAALREFGIEPPPSWRADDGK